MVAASQNHLVAGAAFHSHPAAEALRRCFVAGEARRTDLALLMAYYRDWEEGAACYNHKMVCRTRLMGEVEFRHRVLRPRLGQFAANYQGQAVVRPRLDRIVVNWLTWLHYRELGCRRVGIEQHLAVGWRHTKCNS